ncbi:FCD domain-containing protein [Acetomicrobium sp.]|uniref:FCD domain-containing protein n=1 Tax=Acetomicrobium sp. TaxID=1872099 RepID=UPI002FCC07D4
MDSREEVEYLILNFYSVKNNPQGAGAIGYFLKEKGFELGEATVGRILKKLENDGFLNKVGFQGRILSEKGKDYLKRVRSLREKEESLRIFGHFLFTEEGTYVRDILIARRALESEAAALAAENATKEDLQEMGKILREMEKLLASNKSMAVTDVMFHESIAKASKNRIIETALRVIRHGGKDSFIVEKLRNKAGSTIGADHKAIFEAIKNGESEKARNLMTAHLNNILKDLEYVERTIRN